MSALSADHRRIFAGFDAKVATWRSGDGFSAIGTSALPRRILTQSINMNIECNFSGTIWHRHVYD